MYMYEFVNDSHDTKKGVSIKMLFQKEATLMQIAKIDFEDCQKKIVPCLNFL